MFDLVQSEVSEYFICNCDRRDKSFFGLWNFCFPTEKRPQRKHILILTNSTIHLVIYVSLNVANK